MKWNKKCLIGIFIIIVGIALIVFSILNMIDSVESYNNIENLKENSKLIKTFSDLKTVEETSLDAVSTTIRVIIGEMISAVAFILIGVYQMVSEMKKKN